MSTVEKKKAKLRPVSVIFFSYDVHTRCLDSTKIGQQIDRYGHRYIL